MKIPAFNENILRKLADVLAETSGGLTGFEIGLLLRQVDIHDSDLTTKRHRLFDALKKRQDKDCCGNLELRLYKLQWTQCALSWPKCYFSKSPQSIKRSS